MQNDLLTPEQALVLGTHIRDARLRMGIRASDLGAIVGRDKSNILRLELGQVRNPDVALLQRIAVALDLPISGMYAVAGLQLPQLQPYLRASYGLSAEAAVKAQSYIERLARDYGADGLGPAGSLDEHPEVRN